MTAATRTRLRAKARLGRWDHRYLDFRAGIPHVFGENTTADRALRRAITRAFGKHGLIVTATTNGLHAAGSFHKLGRAVDLGLVPSEVGTSKGHRRLVNFQRDEFEAFEAGQRPNLKELIGPDNNMVVLKGKHSPLANGSPLENQHDNHVHEAF